MPSKDRDPFANPKWERYAERVRRELIPMINDSAVTLSLVPSGKTDVKFAIELGFMIMLDKPIIAVVTPGTKVPAKLIAVADEIVEGEISDPDFQERLRAAIMRVRPEEVNP
jgi:nucleoside 2-deoxyribosyltransferase